MEKEQGGRGLLTGWPPQWSSNTHVEIVTAELGFDLQYKLNRRKAVTLEPNPNPWKPLHHDCFVLLEEKVTNPFNLSVTLIGKVKMLLVPTSDVS